VKNEVHVVAIQMESVPMDAAANARRIDELVERAAADGPLDLVVVPELASVGYIPTGRHKEGNARYIESAEKIPGPFTAALARVARTHSTFVVAGMCQAHDDIPGAVFNSAVLLDPSGELRGVYQKMHIPGEEKHYFLPGNVTTPFRTELGTIGIQICADLWHPELGRVQALQGSEITVGLWAAIESEGTGSPPTMVQNIMTARAIENKVYAIGCNAVGRFPSLWSDRTMTFYGRSTIVDPFGVPLATGGEGEEVLRATLRHDLLMQERAWHTVFRDRRPEHYELLSRPF
jgi:predicted amidohydrolase